MAEPSFEKDLERLEAIVAELEGGELSLDQSLKRFEEGVRLAKRCEKALTKAEKKIEILVKSSEGELRAEPFGEETHTELPEDEEGEEEEERDEGEKDEGLLF